MAGQDNEGISAKAAKDGMKDDGAAGIDPTWRPIVKWGGLCMFIAGVIVILYIIGQGALGMTIPLDAEEVLEEPLAPTSLFILCIVGEFMLLPGFLALFFALRNDDKAKMFMATALGSFSVIMFMCSRSLIISLSFVSGSYHDATSETLREAYLAAAEASLWTQHTLSTLALVFLSLASILAGIVMLKSRVFGRGIGYVAILSGILTVLTPFQALAGMIVIAFIGLVLMLIWQFTVGFKLFRLGRSGASPTASVG